MRRLELSAPAQLGALSLLLGSPGFVQFAVEYRSSTVSTFCFVAGLWFWLRGDSRLWSSFLVGVCLSAAGGANIRIAPLAAFTLLLVVLIPRRSSSESLKRILSTGAGAGIPVLVVGGWLGLAGALGEGWTQLIRQNALAEGLLPDYPFCSALAEISESPPPQLEWSERRCSTSIWRESFFW